MRIILFALLLALSACVAPPRYRLVCVPIEDGVIGCIGEPIVERKP